MFILSESVRILQRYVNTVGLMEKNDQTYRCNDDNYIETYLVLVLTEGSRGFPQFLKRRQ
jgi:hypothetical protein